MTIGESPAGSRPHAPQGRRALDTAQGILIGLRRCSTDAAFDELVRAANTHFVPVFSMASALVELAADTVGVSRLPERALAAARDAWGPLLGASRNDAPSRQPQLRAHERITASALADRVYFGGVSADFQPLDSADRRSRAGYRPVNAQSTCYLHRRAVGRPPGGRLRR